MAVGLREPHRQIDGGVIGHVEKQNLRGAGQQHSFDQRRGRRQAALHQRGEQVPQGAEPPQHGGDDDPHQRAIALGQCVELAAGFELLVERTLLPQHPVDDVGGDAARGEARRRRGGLGLGFAGGHGRLSCLAFACADNAVAGGLDLRRRAVI